MSRTYMRRKEEHEHPRRQATSSYLFFPPKSTTGEYARFRTTIYVHASTCPEQRAKLVISTTTTTVLKPTLFLSSRQHSTLVTNLHHHLIYKINHALDEREKNKRISRDMYYYYLPCKLGRPRREYGFIRIHGCTDVVLRGYDIYLRKHTSDVGVSNLCRAEGGIWIFHIGDITRRISFFFLRMFCAGS